MRSSPFWVFKQLRMIIPYHHFRKPISPNFKVKQSQGGGGGGGRGREGRGGEGRGLFNS
jgi:hypothetical protein